MTSKNFVDFNLNIVDGVSSILTGYYIYFIYKNKIPLGFVDLLLILFLIQ